MEEQSKLKTVDVIIPVYQPKESFKQLLKQLERQSYPIGKIIIINTRSGVWEDPPYHGEALLEIHHIEKAEYDHGGTRHWALSFSQADIFLCLTDDAVPADSRLVEQLVEGFSLEGPAGQRPAMVYARQLPVKGCTPQERYARQFNYPKVSRIKTKEDIEELGIKTYFASNACCAYDRQIYDRLGGFTRRTIFNEDMIFAANAIRNGYAVVYRAEARAVHSHNYSWRQNFRRNFDLAVSQADHPEVFEGLPSEGEGIRLVRMTASYLAKKKMKKKIPGMLAASAFKYLGYLFGKHYRRLPKKIVVWCSMNRAYWEKTGEKL